MSKLLVVLLFFVMFAFADKPSGTWRFARTNSVHSSAWNHAGELIDLGNRLVCHYAGQINFPPNKDGFGDDILILHLALAQAMEENGKIIGLFCAIASMGFRLWKSSRSV